MSDDPTPAQALLLFGLLARHGECPQAEVLPKVKAGDREALVKAKLIHVATPGRSSTLSLTDSGWAWVSNHLSAPLPPAYRTLSELLARLGEDLERRGATLADVIGVKPETEPQPAPVKPAAKPRGSRQATPASKTLKQKLPTTPQAEQQPVPAKPAAKPRRSSGASSKPRTPKPKPPTLAESKARIETAYLAVTGGRRDRAVLLSRLASEVGDLPRASLDAVFGRILKGVRDYSKMSLMRHDDPRQLSQADHAAAYNPAGEPFHVLWIAS